MKRLLFELLFWHKLKTNLYRPNENKDGSYFVVLTLADHGGDERVWLTRWCFEKQHFRTSGGWFNPNEIQYWVEIPGQIKNEEEK